MINLGDSSQLYLILVLINLSFFPKETFLQSFLTGLGFFSNQGKYMNMF